MHPNVYDLQEFRFYVGDPRLCLLKYLERFSSVGSYVNSDNNLNDLIKFKCYRNTPNDKSKRGIIMPIKKGILKSFSDLIESSDKPILIFPILIINKYSCSQGSNFSKHVNYILYNKYTHEVERLDIKKYHIKKFVAKLMYKYTKTEFIDKLNDTSVFLESDLDIPINYVSKYKDETIRSMFPSYFIKYISLRCKYPKLKVDKIHEKVLNITEAEGDKMWNEYKIISSEMVVGKCKDNEFYKYENMRCVLKDTPSYNNLLIDKADKICKGNRVFNILTNKCVDPKKLKDINILIDNFIDIKLSSKEKFVSLGNDKTRLLGILFVLSKHPAARLVYPYELDKSYKKGDFSLLWSWDKSNNKYIFYVPQGMEKSWNANLKNPDVRFLVIFLGLHSKLGGHHANCLIYDKKHNEIERFDSLGSSLHEDYDIHNCDIEIQKWLQTVNPPNIKFFKPIDYCIKELYQLKELDQIGYDDTKGNCAVWRLWYIDLRLSNPELTRKEAVKLSSSKLELLGGFQKFIKAYQVYITMNIPITKRLKK